MNHRLAACAVTALLAAGCGSAASTSSSPAASGSPGAPGGSPAASATPAPPPSVIAVYVLGGSGGSLHVVTYAGGTAQDRTVLHGVDDALLAASPKTALVLTNGQPGKAETVDLASGATHQLDVDTSYGVNGVFSPDGSRLLIAQSNSGGGDTLRVMTLASGSTTTLAVHGMPDLSPAHLYPRSWGARGIVVSVAYPDGPPDGAWLVDPSTGKATGLSSESVEAISADARQFSNTQTTSLGDDPCQCQGDWRNTLYVSPVGGPAVRVAQERDRNFGPIDVRGSGRLLYSVDDSGLGPDKSGKAADAGLYLYAGGASVRQLTPVAGLAYASWQGRFLDDSAAIVATPTGVAQNQDTTGVAVDVLHLCDTPGCQASVTRLATLSGTNAYANIVVTEPDGSGSVS